MSDSALSLADITARLHSDIPLTRAMGVQIARWDGSSVTLSAPLAPNHNHTDTAFGGSISALSILAGYALLYLLLKDRQIAAHLLIQKSNIDYLRPIDSDFLAIAALPSGPEVEGFLNSLQQKRRSRLAIDSQIHSNDTLSATHSGLYVAISSLTVVPQPSRDFTSFIAVPIRSSRLSYKRWSISCSDWIYRLAHQR